MSETSDGQQDKDARDRRYGEALAGVLRSAAPQGPCLSGDEIDILVEGRATGAERERLLAHLAGCEPCLRSFGVAAHLKREEQQAARKKLWLRVPAAVAALLVVGISVLLTRHTPPAQIAMRSEAPPVREAAPAPPPAASPVAPPASPAAPAASPAAPAAPAAAPAAPSAAPAAPAAPLSHPAEPAQIAAAPAEPSAPAVSPLPEPAARAGGERRVDVAFGKPKAAKAAKAAKPADEFAPALTVLAALPPTQEALAQEERRAFAAPHEGSRNRRKFTAGGELLSASVELARGERDPASERVNHAAELLGEAGKAQGGELSKIAQDLPDGELKALGRRIERLYTPAGPSVDPYLALGAWSKAALLSASARNDALYGTAWFTQTGKSLAAGNYPQDVLAATRQILDLTARPKDQIPYGRIKVQVRRLEELVQ